MALERMLAGLSTRRYPVGLEPVGGQVDDNVFGDKQIGGLAQICGDDRNRPGRAAVAADLSGLDLVALMIDGVHFAESCCVVALGIDIEGIKHPLALVEGSTENATLVCGLAGGPA